MSRLKHALAAAVAVVAACAAAPAVVVASSAAPPPIGDSCLVGRWVETLETAPGNWAWNGAVIAVTGLRGMVVTFSPDGTETDDLSLAQPLIGDDQGHQLKIVERGRMRFRVHADGALLVQAAPVGSVPVSFYFDGRQIQGGAAYPASVYAYRCAGATLHRETVAHVSGYGPQVDDLVRASVAPTSGSLESTVSAALPTPAAVLAAPLTLMVSAVIALAAILLVTFPSHLFNRTYEENHEVIRYWWERRFPWVLRLRVRTLARSRRRLRDGAGFLAVVVCGGVLAAALDPGFGPNLRTLALFTGAVLALLAGCLIGFGATAGYRIARQAGSPWHLQALPSGLVIAALCVLVSRLTDFQPGYLYGLIGGVVFARQLELREEGHVVAVTSIATLLIAVGAWLAWVPASGRAHEDPASFGWALATNFLAALFVSGMVGLLIGLVPLRFLPGEKLARWHRGVWGAVFGLAAVSVVEVMLRPQNTAGRMAPAPLVTTAALFVGFGVVSVSFWAYFRARRQVTATPIVREVKSPES